jgi:hypothetical protein
MDLEVRPGFESHLDSSLYDPGKTTSLPSIGNCED